jgi:RNA polymerase sigma factor (TIGR02999 family)
MPELEDEIRALLEASEQDGGPPFDGMVAKLYADLRRVARGQVRRGPQPTDVGTTSLVHETYLKLSDRDDSSYRDTSHFLAVAARTMRHIVIDHARRRTAHKRGSGQVALPLLEDQVPDPAPEARFLELDQALERLQQVEPRLVAMIECRFFAGLTEKETALALGVTERTVQRDWSRARTWLRETLGS